MGKFCSRSYVPQLDGLRGAAILSVIIFHAGAPFLRGGFVGVDVFFVLSGFLITSLLIKEFDTTKSISLKNFYVRRILRLGPALLLLLTVFCLLSVVLLSEEKAIRNLVDALISLVYLSNWARAFSIHPPDFLGHTWSLSIEEQFYITWPIILLLLLRRTTNRWHIVTFATFVALTSWFVRIHLAMNEASAERLYNGLDTRADTLMVGCTLGILLSPGLLKQSRKTLSKWLVIAAPLSAITLLAFSILSNWRDLWMYHWGFFVVELLTSVLILDIYLNPRSIIGQLLSMRWLVWIGSISYGLYLWHYPIFRTMKAFGFDVLTVFTVGSITTFFVAACSYYLLERPFLKFKERFTHVTPNKSIQSTSAPLRPSEAPDA